MHRDKQTLELTSTKNKFDLIHILRFNFFFSEGRHLIHMRSMSTWFSTTVEESSLLPLKSNSCEKHI